jgi:hypothetical protein
MSVTKFNGEQTDTDFTGINGNQAPSSISADKVFNAPITLPPILPGPEHRSVSV